MRSFLAVTTVSLVTAIASLASASEPSTSRRPIYPLERNISTLDLQAFETPYTIVRERTELAKASTFLADPKLIDENAVYVFEIESVFTYRAAVKRWRCVAVRDIAECLGRPITVPYLDRDDKLVLTVVAKRKNTEEAQALIEEAKARDQRVVLSLADR